MKAAAVAVHGMRIPVLGQFLAHEIVDLVSQGIPFLRAGSGIAVLAAPQSPPPVIRIVRARTPGQTNNRTNLIDGNSHDSNATRLAHRVPVRNISRVQCRSRLEQQDMNLVGGDRPMFDATGDDQQLPFFQPDLPVTKIHPESSLHDQEQLVLIFMVMPDELALKLDQFDLLTIQFANDSGDSSGRGIGRVFAGYLLFPSVHSQMNRSSYSIPYRSRNAKNSS